MRITRIKHRLDNVGRPDNFISRRLAIYGQATCPICGNFMESVWARQGRRGTDLVCREHPGHPLHNA